MAWVGIPAAIGGTVIAGRTAKRALTPDIPQPQVPKTPTIDDARRNTDEIDRIRRRRGVLANIFAGQQASSPTVGTKQLLGQ